MSRKWPNHTPFPSSLEISFGSVHWLPRLEFQRAFEAGFDPDYVRGVELKTSKKPHCQVGHTAYLLTLERYVSSSSSSRESMRIACRLDGSHGGLEGEAAMLGQFRLVANRRFDRIQRARLSPRMSFGICLETTSRPSTNTVAPSEVQKWPCVYCSLSVILESRW